METKQKTMNTKHTPGPWRARIDAILIDVVQIKSGFGIVHIGTNRELRLADYPIDQAAANAKLIAAAPELLEALIAIKEYCQYWRISLGSGVIHKVDTAIQKATE